MKKHTHGHFWTTLFWWLRCYDHQAQLPGSLAEFLRTGSRWNPIPKQLGSSTVLFRCSCHVKMFTTARWGQRRGADLTPILTSIQETQEMTQAVLGSSLQPHLMLTCIGKQVVDANCRCLNQSSIFMYYIWNILNPSFIRYDQPVSWFVKMKYGPSMSLLFLGGRPDAFWQAVSTTLRAWRASSGPAPRATCPSGEPAASTTEATTEMGPQMLDMKRFQDHHMLPKSKFYCWWTRSFTSWYWTSA